MSNAEDLHTPRYVVPCVRESKGSDTAAGDAGTRPRAEYLARCVDAALVPVREHLSPRHIKFIHSILLSNIEHDPVSRRLVADALHAPPIQPSMPSPGDQRPPALTPQVRDLEP